MLQWSDGQGVCLQFLPDSGLFWTHKRATSLKACNNTSSRVNWVVTLEHYTWMYLNSQNMAHNVPPMAGPVHDS